jgi:hypothetical protein
MVVRAIKAERLGSGKTVKLGRKRPVARGPLLKMSNYLRATLPAAPASVDYTAPASSVLSKIYLNDQLGDCVIAGGYHVVGTETGNAGDLFTATDQQIVLDYSAIGGYDPNNKSVPNDTDRGCDEPTAFNYWQEHGFANGTKLLGWLSVDATNRAELSAAAYLFENLFFAVELPDQWIENGLPPSGFVWDVAGDANPNNGHCVIGVGYNDVGVQIDTWGVIGTVTWAALAKYFTPQVYGAAYVLLTPDQLAKGRVNAPNGVSWASLIADFDSIGGTVTTPQGFDVSTMTGVQQALNYLGANPQLAVDGIEGAQTRAAIKSFQGAHGLTADGIVGRKTRAALRTAVGE